MTELLLLEAAAIVLLSLALARRRRASRPLVLVFGVLLVAVTATFALALGSRRAAEVASRRELTGEVPHLGRDGFVSSDACRACHPDQYASWHASYHRTMTQLAHPGSVIGPFDGRRITSGARSFRVFRRGEEFWAELPDPDVERRRRVARFGGAAGEVEVSSPAAQVERRVVMTTGSHHMQTYWVPSRSGREVYNLPLVYLLETGRWVPREEVFLRPPEAGPLMGLWNNTCIECHSTGGEIGFDFAEESFDSRVAELGITCEACHGPGAEHVLANRSPVRRYAQHLKAGGDPTMVHPERLDHRRSSEVCGQCHGVWLVDDPARWLEKGHGFRPGDALEEERFVVRPAVDRDHPRIQQLLAEAPNALASRFWSDGMVRVSGREYNGLIESPCFQRGTMSCLSCHSMHESAPDDQLAAGMRGDAACLQCHSELGSGEALGAHTRHPVSSTGSRCMNCHMPYTTFGLLKAIRSHQVSSPNVATALDTGRPDACTLCHLDRPLAWTAEHLGTWYGAEPVALSADRREISAALLWLLTGDAGQRALIAWSMGWAPAQQASGRDWLAPYLGHLLDDPYSAVRYVARRSLETLPDYGALAYDYIGPRRQRQAARAAVIERFLDARPTPPADPGAVLMDRRGGLALAEVQRLSDRRDDRPVYLEE